MLGCGTSEEDTPVTWEALGLPREHPGTGDRRPASDAPFRAVSTGGRCHGASRAARRTKPSSRGKARQGKTGGRAGANRRREVEGVG